MVQAIVGFGHGSWPIDGGGGGGEEEPEPDLIEDYSTYSDTANFLSDPRGIYRESEDNTTNQMLIDTSEHDEGFSQSLRYRYLHSGGGANSITIRRQIETGNREEIWAEFRFKYSTNFTTANAAAPNDHKLIFGNTQAGENGRWAFYIGSDGSDVANHTLMVETPYRTVGSSHKPGTGFQGAYYLTNSPGWAEDIWESGEWHTVRFHLKSTTTNAIFRVWLDGVRIHNETGFGVGDTDGSADLIEGFSWCHNKDDGPGGVEMFLWWQWAKFWWTQSPGWEGDS